MEKILIINFSSREDGNCKIISNYVKDCFSNVKLYGFYDLNFSSCGTCNYECFSTRKCIKDDDLVELRSDLLDASRIIFVVPNYCGFPCSNYFVFNERILGSFASNRELFTKYLFIRKDFLIVSNSNFETLKYIMSYQVLNKEQINCLFISSKDYHNNSLSLWSMDKKVEELVRNHFK
jgi:multimeric flavodoxin WrbA